MLTLLEKHRWLAAVGFVVAAVLVAVLGLALARDSAGPPAGSGPIPATTTTPPTATSAVPATTSATTQLTITRTLTTGPPRCTTSSTGPAIRPGEPSWPFPVVLRGQDLTAVPTSRKLVALTFDVAGDSAGLSRILDILAARHVPATFFVTGAWARANPAEVARIVAGGHRVGNHSMTYPRLTAMSDAAITNEVLAAQRAIRAAGTDPRPLFRFPYGDRNARTIAAVNTLGYLPIRWTVDTLGWQGTSGGNTARQVTDRVLAALRPGEIVRMHVGANPADGSTLDADALPAVIDALRAHGYGFMTLDVLVSRT